MPEALHRKFRRSFVDFSLALQARSNAPESVCIQLCWIQSDIGSCAALMCSRKWTLKSNQFSAGFICNFSESSGRGPQLLVEFSLEPIPVSV